MTDAASRQRVSALSVVALASLAFAASWLVVVRHDALAHERALATRPLSPPPAATPPVAGLRAVAPARVRIVVVRRSRAS